MAACRHGRRKTSVSAATDLEVFLALMQSTDACKNKEPVCAQHCQERKSSPAGAIQD
jgi:hypothetical protein